MAIDFKVGDRVRLVHEGVVSDEPAYGSVRIDGTWRILGKGETVEVLERKVEPYRPGTVVRGDLYTWIVTDEGSIALQTNTGRVAVPKCSVDGEALARGVARRDGTEVVYEPPQ